MIEYILLETGFPVWAAFAGLILYGLEILKNE